MSFATGKLRVLIATTNGPVEVQLLTEEDAIVGRCVACIGGTTETADIAAAYHAFVVRPTGVIEGRFGHSCYRLDVSARIDAGSSWQLGVLAAHALLAGGRLAQENDVADGIVWATGSVRPVDLTVGAVSHVPEKLENSLERIRQERAAGRPVLMAVPAANAGDVSPSAAQQLADLGAELVPVAHAEAILDAFGMKLPGLPPKATTPASAVVLNPFASAENSAPVVSEAKAPRRALGWAVAVLVLIGIVAAGAFAFTRMSGDWLPGTWPSARQTAGNEPQPSPVPLPAPMPEPVPTSTPEPPPSPAPTPLPSQEPVPPPAATPPAEPSPVEPPPHQPPVQQRAQIVPATIPFITSRDRERIRNEYMPAPDFKALAMTMWEIFFVAGLPSQDDADKAALEACEKGKRAAPREDFLSETPYLCDLYASGSAVVSTRSAVSVPPQPWFNALVRRPIVTSQIPIADRETVDRISKRYLDGPGTKALVVSPSGNLYWTFGQSNPNEAMRRTLERCGYLHGTECLVLAINETFVTAVPTLARVVGFYTPDALSRAQPGERADIAQRLSSAPPGWSAVAIGSAGHSGIKLGASTEPIAVQGAIESCAKQDRECRVAVIGPFLVEASTEIEKK